METEDDLYRIDIEEEIKSFTIGKPQSSSASTSIPSTSKSSTSLPSTSKSSRSKFQYIGSCYQNIPMLVSDIQNIELNYNNNKYISCLYNIKFRTLTLYGHAIPLRISSKKDSQTFKYEIDDGTDTVIVHYIVKYKDLQIHSEIDKIESEIKELKKSNQMKSNSEKKNETEDKREGNKSDGLSVNYVGSVDAIFNKMKENMKNDQKYKNFNSNKFFDGIKYVSVIGYPFKNRFTDRIEVSAYEVLEDNSVDRSNEIFFKHMLVDFYQKKILPNLDLDED